MTSKSTTHRSRKVLTYFKGASSLFSFMLVVAMIALGIGIITSSGGSLTDSITSAAQVRSAEDIMNSIDRAVLDVVRDGKDAGRIITFTAPKGFIAISEEDAIQFVVSSTRGAQDYLSRIHSGSRVTIAGNDVSCFEKDENGVPALVVQNSLIRGVFRKFNRTSPLSSIDTAQAIIMLADTAGGTNITFSNSAVYLNGNISTAAGSGFSEISLTGLAVPFCRVRFFVNTSSAQYDLYYKLYAGADFFVTEVDNVI